MKADRRQVYIALNITVLFACLFWGMVLSAGAKKYAGMDTIYIAPVLNHPDYYFSAETAEMLEEQYASGDSVGISGAISYEKVENDIIKNGVTELYSKIIYTNNVYFSINTMAFLDGGPWQKGYNKDSIVVLSDTAAWYLFGSLDVVGKTVTLEDGIYEITGIVSQNRRRNQDSTYYAWIPMGAGDAAADGLTNLFFRDYAYNPLDSTARAKVLLDEADKSAGDYYITDLNQYRHNLEIKRMLPVLLALVYFILLALMAFYNILTTPYMVRQKKMKLSIVCILWAALSTGAFYFIFARVKELLWVTNKSFSLRSAYKILSNSGVFPGSEYLSYQLRELADINDHTNILLALSCICIFNVVFLLRIPFSPSSRKNQAAG